MKNFCLLVFFSLSGFSWYLMYRSYRELVKMGVLKDLGFTLKPWILAWMNFWWVSTMSGNTCSLFFKLSLPMFFLAIIFMGVIAGFGRCLCV